MSLIKQQITLKQINESIQFLVILNRREIVIFLSSCYIIYNIQHRQIHKKYQLGFQVRFPTFNNKLKCILLFTKHNPKKFIKLDPYTAQMSTLYDFSQQIARYNLQVEPFVVVQSLSGTFCLLRRFHNETLVVLFNKQCKKQSQFYINQECLSNYDECNTLVNYRQVMIKNVIVIMLVTLQTKQQKKSGENNIENLQFQVVEDQRGIIKMISYNQKNNIIVSVNSSYSSLFLIADRQTHQILHKVKRSQMLSECFILGDHRYMINYEYWLNQDRIAQTKYTLINVNSGQQEDNIIDNDCGEYKVVSSQDHFWIDYGSGENQNNQRSFNIYEVCRRNKLLMHLCVSYLAKNFQGQFVSCVYNLLK